MDSPDSKTSNFHNNKNPKLINPSSSDSSAFQDSPVFSYISNLSPIQPVKAAPVAQGFPGLASPPLVFTSPRINLQTSFFNRQPQTRASNSKFSEENHKSQKYDEKQADSANQDSELHSPLISSDQKGRDTPKLVQVSQCSPSGCFDDFLTDPMERSNSLHKIQSDHVPQSSVGGCLEKEDSRNSEDMDLDGSSLQVTESAKAKSRTEGQLVKNEPQHLIASSSGCSDIVAHFSKDHTSELCQTRDTVWEASHLEHGTLRRCLFDEKQRTNFADVRFQDPNDNLTTIRELHNMSSTGTLGSRHMINLSKSISGLSGPSSARNNPVAISKPLVSKPQGIGLHLNSVVYPISNDSAIGSQQSSEKVVRVKGKNSVFVMSNQSTGKVTNPIPCNSIGKGSASSEEMHKNKARPEATSGKASCTDAVEQLNDPLLLEPADHSSVLYEKRKFNSELAESHEEFNHVSPKKKRINAPSTNDDDSSKRCNCKKTKCLKLYCDCFAAGFYCAESCSCQGCFNRPEYEDTVLETRQQIESRNPLAFAPKVVQPLTDSPASNKEVGISSTPSSARHKRGCNCKKSMCLKKYCECYQANVGCSDGCRCEGCKNVYGKREVYSIAREIMIKKVTDENSEGTLDEKQEILTVSNDSLSNRAHNSPNMTPVTPALQCSDQRKNAHKSRLAFGRFLHSRDSPHDTLPSSTETFPTLPRNSQSHRMLLDKGVNSEEGRENSEDGLVTRVQAADSKNVSQPQSLAGSGLAPPSSSLRWRSLPVTLTTQFPGSEFLQDFDSGSKLTNVLEDDTPEILKDLSTAAAAKSVKVSSPNKKRVSPPHNHVDSSASLKGSRKFVLQAVPPFPPLTPYSKKSTNDNRSE